MGHSEVKLRGRIRQRLLALSLAVSFLTSSTASASTAPASSSSLTYQGRILKSDGTPFENSNVSFVFQILDPSGQCVIYQEQADGINMTNSGGVFDLPIGIGSIQYISGTGASTVVDIFNNGSNYHCGSCTSTGTSYSCTATATPYAPLVTDGRLLRVSFYDGSGWNTISPDNIIRSVPYAGYSVSAQKLGTNVASDFLLKAGLPTCSSGTFLTWDGSSLTCSGVAGASGGTVTNVTSANSYITVTNGTSTPTLTLNVGTTANTVAAGNDTRITNALQTGAAAGGNLSGTYPNPTVSALQGVPLSASAPSSGQLLKYNGTNWSATTLTTSDISNLSSTLSGYVTQSAFNGYVTSAGCSTSQTLYWNSVSGNFQCQNISVTSFSGALAGDVTGTQAATKVVALQNQPVSSTAPTSNQVLQWNAGAGQWTPTTLPASSGGTVTQVNTGTGLIGGPITTSGTLAVDIGTTASKIVQLDASAKLPAVDGSQLINLSAANISSGTLSSAQMPALTGDVTAAAGSTTTTLAKIQGATLTVSSLASGNYLKYNGTAWVNATPSSADLSDSGSLIKSSQMPANCSANQTLNFSSPTGTWTCANIGGLDASTLTTGTIASARLPASASYWQAATGGINYASGNVGIGTTTPAAALDILSGSLRFSTMLSGNGLAGYSGGGVNIMNLVRDDSLHSGGLTMTAYGGIGFSTGVTSASNNYNMYIDNTGRVGLGTNSPTAQLHVYKTATTGTISSSGTAVTGSGTNFMTSLNVGDSISAGGSVQTITAITSDTSLTTSAAFSPALAGSYWGRVGAAFASGYVGVGTSQPTYPLYVTASGPSPEGITQTGLYGNTLDLNKAYTATTNEDVYMNLNKQTTSGGSFARYGYLQAGDIHGGLVLQGQNGSGGTGYLLLNATGGNVGIGTSSPATALHVSSGAGYTVIANENLSAGGNQWRWYSSSTGAPLGANAMCFGVGTCLFSLYSSGNATLYGTLTQSSDIRLKKDITSIPNALAAIEKMDGVTYYWKDSAKDSKQQIGLIAQDVEKVFPQAVNTDSSGFKSVAYQNLVAPIINAIKELSGKFTELEKHQATQSRQISSVVEENTILKNENKMMRDYLCHKDPTASFCDKH